MMDIRCILLCTIFYCFLMDLMDGIESSIIMCRLTQIHLRIGTPHVFLKLNIMLTICILARINIRLFIAVGNYSNSMWLTCGHLLIKLGCHTSVLIKANFMLHCTVVCRIGFPLTMLLIPTSLDRELFSPLHTLVVHEVCSNVIRMLWPLHNFTEMSIYLLR